MRRNGFTLIELMMAVVIIGIVAAIAAKTFGDVRIRAVIATIQSDLRSVHLAQEFYYQTHDLTYADEVDDLTGAGFFTPTRGVVVEITAADPSSWKASATHVSTGAACEFSLSSRVTECSYQGRSGRRIGGPTDQTIVAGPAPD